MRYCNSCHRLTSGEPLFCNFCGRSYEARLCPGRHLNPRSAEVCSQCGSRDLSTPQRPIPFWVGPLLYVVSLVPGTFLLLVTVLFFVGLVQALVSNQQLMGQALATGLVLGLAWYCYMHLPHFVRNALRRVTGRKAKGREERHGH